MAEEAKWYVVHTYSGYENKVKANIEKSVENRGISDMIQAVEVPLEDVVEEKNGVEKIVKRKVFPGYVVIKMVMNDESWFVVRNTRGVTGFVGPASKPVPLTDAEVAALGVDQHSVEVKYGVGDIVRIVSGPLKGTEGTVISIDPAKNCVNVKISMLGQEIPAEMELNQVTPVF